MYTHLVPKNRVTDFFFLHFISSIIYHDKQCKEEFVYLVTFLKEKVTESISSTTFLFVSHCFLYYFSLFVFFGVFCSFLSFLTVCLIFKFNNEALLAHLFFQMNFAVSLSSEKLLWGCLSAFY